MMVSIPPPAPHLASGSAAASPLPPLSESATPTPPPSSPSPADFLAYTGMEMLSGLDMTLPVPPPLDVALLQAPVGKYLREARLRLLPTLPGRFFGITNSTSMWSWWCRSCGALPDGWMGTDKGKASGSGSGSRTPTGRRRKGGQKTPKKRTADDMEADDVQADIQTTLENIVSELGVVPPARRPPASPLNRRRKPVACDTCGSPMTRSRPTINLPPARLVTRNSMPPSPSAPSDATNVAAVGPDAALLTSTPSSIPSTPATVSPQAIMLPPPPPTTAPPSPPRPTLLSTPSLKHIPKSPGDLPTYQRPPVVPPPAPNGASQPVKIPPGGGLLPPLKKRKKKSGLAKLLAHNAEREAESKGSGNWGLG